MSGDAAGCVAELGRPSVIASRATGFRLTRRPPRDPRPSGGSPRQPASSRATRTGPNGNAQTWKWGTTWQRGGGQHDRHTALTRPDGSVVSYEKSITHPAGGSSAQASESTRRGPFPSGAELSPRRGGGSPAPPLPINRGRWTLLSRETLERLVRHQREARLPLGEALVALGHVSARRLGALLDQFKNDPSPFETGQRSLPSALVGVRIAALTLDLLPRFCMRVARLHVKLAPARPHGADLGLPHRVALGLRGSKPLEIGVAADDDVASALAVGISGQPRPSLEAPLVGDGLGEFLDLLVGISLAALEREGVLAHLEPVRRGALPAAAHVFDLIATVGRGALVVSPSALG